MIQQITLLILLSLLISCGGKPQPQDPVPAHDSFKLESKIVNETRVINVWTPPAYTKDSMKQYDVLYMLDGGVKEDFPHIANTIAKLVEFKSIPPTLLVGIENTQRRRDLTGPSDVMKDKEIAPLTDGASIFRAFIKDELFGEIDSRYRTTNNRAIVGESVAGLFIVETFLLSPDMFDTYIAMDPSLWWNDAYYVKNASTILSSISDTKTKLWFAGSNAEDISVHTRKLAQTLESKSPINLTWKYADKPKEHHNTIFRATKEAAFKWALSEK